MEDWEGIQIRRHRPLQVDQRWRSGKAGLAADVSPAVLASLELSF